MTSRASPTANILIADDTVENLRLLVTMLGGEGYEVRPVTGGRQALLAAERDAPDLILLDIGMPDLNGYEVCAELKARPSLRDIPVIFLTALSDVANKVRAFEVGGVDYITKPFQLEEVQARVRTHVSLRRARLGLSQSLERLRAVEQLRDDLVHMLVHDMRSPLMALIGHLGFVQKQDQGVLSRESLDDLEVAAHCAKVVTQMANELVDVSRLEDSQMPVEYSENELGQMLRGVVDSLGRLDSTRVIQLDVPSDLILSCDSGLIRRVLENLISNAIKHTPAGGSILIAASNASGKVSVSVSDEGSGVPEESRQRIFEKFGTIALRRDRQYHSVGLGLAFCKLAIQAHGGEIGVSARQPQGSVFWFELPHRR